MSDQTVGNILRRHGGTTRILTIRGVSLVFVAQIIGHSPSSNIMDVYAKAIDEYRRSAISKLEALREAQSVQATIP
jgi:hypothetical protein